MPGRPIFGCRSHLLNVAGQAQCAARIGDSHKSGVVNTTLAARGHAVRIMARRAFNRKTVAGVVHPNIVWIGATVAISIEKCDRAISPVGLIEVGQIRSRAGEADADRMIVGEVGAEESNTPVRNAWLRVRNVMA